jgi:hypothetical protein
MQSRLHGFLVLWAATCLLLTPAALLSQRQNNGDVLTDQQTEDLRQAADDPNEKVKLYLGYIEERTTEIHRLSGDLNARNRAAELHNLFAEFTRLSDELEDNLDSYEQQHADMRKALKLIVDKSEKWPETLNQPKPDPEYDFARKTALDAAQSVHTDTQKMLADETQYFAEQKKEKKGKS